MSSTKLEIANIDENTPDPLPGANYYVRYPGTNIPTGYLCETTVHTTANAIPFNTVSNVANQLEKGLDYYAQLGFTGIVDAGDLHSTTYDAVKQLRDQNKLNMYYQRGYWASQALSVKDNINKLKQLDKEYSGGNYRCNLYKMFMDGTIDAESGALIEPYSNSGKVVNPFFNMKDLVEILNTLANVFDIQRVTNYIFNRSNKLSTAWVFYRHCSELKGTLPIAR